MKGFTVLALVLGPLAAATAGAAPQQQALTVVVGDHVGVANSTLKKAVELAREILFEAGVATEWTACPSSRSQSSSYYPCLFGVAQPGLVLRIVPKPKPDHCVPRAALGLALAGNPGEFGTYAYLFYNRLLEATALCSYCREHQVLGLAMAHEVGHLLGNRHSTSGIMRPNYNWRGLVEMSRGCLSFSREEGRRMRANVAARMLPLSARQPKSRP